ncbi:hypothetical protein F5Y16DRAFT_406595 [Xylariaceae sp. FL0255]|nr:hypothetical protein F5Y16DRAFT_406595 [Xylariaceae sp. FL0255]
MLTHDACGNEWQYLNFDTNNDTDVEHLYTLHDIICSEEVRALASYGSLAATAGNAVYKRYFTLSNDIDGDTQGDVASVLNLIAGTSDTDGLIGDVAGTFVVDNLNFTPTGSDSPDFTPACAKSETLAFTDTDKLDDREKIHFCDIAWGLPSGTTRVGQCANFDPYPSLKIDTFSRLALHEMMHYSSVGPASTMGLQITDTNNDDGHLAYGPLRNHGLVDPNQDNNPGLADVNADNYAWLSLDAWISRMCAADIDTWDQFFTQNPPNYK